MVCDEPTENELPSAAPIPTSISEALHLQEGPRAKSAAARTALYLHAAPPPRPLSPHRIAIPDYVAAQHEPFPTPPQPVSAVLLPPERTSITQQAAVKALKEALSALSLSSVDTGTSSVTAVKEDSPRVVPQYASPFRDTLEEQAPSLTEALLSEPPISSAPLSHRAHGGDEEEEVPLSEDQRRGAEALVQQALSLVVTAPLPMPVLAAEVPTATGPGLFAALVLRPVPMPPQ